MSSFDTSFRSSQGAITNDNRPLTDQELVQVQRLLSDPFSFPNEFKTWLVNYLETSDLTLPMSAIMGLQALLGITGAGEGALGVLPAGLIFPFGGATAPVGALLCDGGAYPIATYKRLHDVIGDVYGSAPAGSFLVPDLQERIPVGKGTIAAHDTLGKNDGLALGSRGVRHQHGQHLHQQTRQNADLAPGGTTYAIVGIGDDDGPLTRNAQVGPAGTPMDTPAYFTLNFIIVA